MALRKSKQKTVRDQLSERIDDFVAQAEEIGHSVAERAGEERQVLATRIDAGVSGLRERLPEFREGFLERLPELSDETYEKLPSSVQERLPDQVKPKKRRRLRKIVGVGLLAGAGGATYVVWRSRSTPAAQNTYPAPVSVSKVAGHTATPSTSNSASQPGQASATQGPASAKPAASGATSGASNPAAPASGAVAPSQGQPSADASSAGSMSSTANANGTK